MHSNYLSTLDYVPGREVIQSLGLVRGNAVRSRAIGADILSGVRLITGGELAEYTKLLAEVREQALDRLVAEAKARGADVVIGLRFQTCEVIGLAAEMLAYGTAVKLAEPAPSTGAESGSQVRTPAY